MKDIFDTPIPRVRIPSVKWNRYAGTDILPMWLADMDLPVAETIKDMLLKSLDQNIYGYSSPPSELINVVRDYLEHEFYWRIEKDWIIWLPGVLPSLIASCKTAGSIGDEIINQPPVFSEFFNIVGHAQRTLIEVPMIFYDEHWTFDMEALEKAITPLTKALLLCYPNNPTGTLFTREELVAVTKLCARHNVMIISDEIHSGLVIDPHKEHLPLSVIAPWYADNIITLLSPSKTFNLGGVNCAYAVISNSKLRDRFINACQSLGIMPMASAFGYAATIAAYRDSKQWRYALIDYLRENYLYLQRELNAIPLIKLHPLDATYLAWIDISKLRLDDSKKFFEECGVGISPGKEFGNSDFIRLNFACPRSMLELAVKRIIEGVKVHIGFRSILEPNTELISFKE